VGSTCSFTVAVIQHKHCSYLYQILQSSPQNLIMNRVSRSLYRSLFKIAKNFDDAPSSKALLYRKTLDNTSKSVSSVYYTNLLDQLFEKKSYLYQPKGDVKSLVELVRVGSRDVNDATLSVRLDAGFAALRKLSMLWNSFICLDSDDDDGDSGKS
jgi:hypothetical protein